MRFFAHENFPRAAVEALEQPGQDITWERATAPGSTDGQVLACAAREGRILLTFDKGFGELARTAMLLAGCGMILFRRPMPLAKDIEP